MIKETIEASKPTEFSYNDLRNMIKESLIKEGGNIFVDDEGGVATIRIVKGDVQATLEWLEKIVDLPLVGNELGTTGVTATSGDLDVAVDEKQHEKAAIEEKLIQWVIEKHPELELNKLPAAREEKNRWHSINLNTIPTEGEVEVPGFKEKQSRQTIRDNRDRTKKELKRLNTNKRKWMAMTGVSLHFKTPIRGNEGNFVQTDLMFGDPEFMKWAVKGEPEGSKYRGVHRQLLINSIATARGYAWNSFKGLRHRQTDEEITDKEEIAKVLLGPEYTSKNLESFQGLIKIVEKMDDYEELVYAAVGSFPDQTGIEFPPPEEEMELPKKEEEPDLLDEAKGVAPRTPHAEDLLFSDGSVGALRVLNFLERMNDSEGRPETSLKWDGSPAVILGRDKDGNFTFADKHQKGTISNAADMEKAYKARAERSRAREKAGISVDVFYKKVYGDLVPKMQTAHKKIINAINKDHRGLFFGEILYFDTPEIEDGKYVFEPNIVKYKIPTDSELGEKIKNSTLGIVLHTTLDLDGQQKPLNYEGLDVKNAPGVLFFDKVFIENPVEVDEEEISGVKQEVEQNAALIDNFFNLEVLAKKRIKSLWKIFQTYVNGRVETSLENLGGEDFFDWLNAKNYTVSMKRNIRAHVDENGQAYDKIWEIFTRIMKIKDQIVDNIESQGGLVFSQHIGDEEVGEGYVVSDEGKLVKLVARSKFTKANRAVMREQDEGDVVVRETHVFIPGGFKPPHKGHVTLLEKALEKYPKAKKIYIVSGGDERGVEEVPGFKITKEQSKKVWNIYLKGLGIPEKIKIELDYFEAIKTKRIYSDTKINKKKGLVGEPIFTSSPFTRIGLRLANDGEIDSKSKVVAVSPFDDHINFVEKSVDYLNENENKKFDFEALKVPLLEDPDSPETTPEDASEEDDPENTKLSAGNMRKAIAYNKFEDFKRFMPDFIFEEEAKKIFAMLGGQVAPAEEAEEQPEEPQEEIEEMSMVSGGGIAGYAGGIGTKRKRKRKRKRRMEETNYIKMKETLTHEEDILKEYLVEKYITKLRPLMEQDMSDPKFRLGVNLTSRAFNDIKKNYLEPFAELLVTDEEKMSYMVHILAKLGHVFIQHDINRGIKDIALDQEFAQKLVSRGILTPEIAHEAGAAAVAALEERDVREAEEKVSLEIGDENIVTEPEEKETKEAPIEVPEEPLPGMNQTGGNFSNDALTKIKVQLMDDYNLIGAEEGNKVARQAFIEYSYKNLIAVTAAQYAGRTMPEPLNSMYAAIKNTGDIVREPVPEGTPAEAPAPEAAAVPEEAPAAPLAESDIGDVIKQSIIKTFRELNFS